MTNPVSRNHRLAVARAWEGDEPTSLFFRTWIDGGLMGSWPTAQETIHMLERLAQLVADAEGAWIPCSERLPDDDAIVLVFGHYEGTGAQWDWQAVCRFEGDTGLWLGIPTDCASDEATHWRPLPAKPPEQP